MNDVFFVVLIWLGINLWNVFPRLLPNMHIPTQSYQESNWLIEMLLKTCKTPIPTQSYQEKQLINWDGFKNVKNTNGGALLLIKLQAKA